MNYIKALLATAAIILPLHVQAESDHYTLGPGIHTCAKVLAMGEAMTISFKED